MASHAVHFPTELEPLRLSKSHSDESVKYLTVSVSSVDFSGTIAHAIVSQAPTGLRKTLSSTTTELERLDGVFKKSELVLHVDGAVQ